MFLITGPEFGDAPSVSFEHVSKRPSIERQHMVSSLSEAAEEEARVVWEPVGIGRRDDQFPARSDNRVESLQHKARVGQVFNEVASNNEIEGLLFHYLTLLDTFNVANVESCGPTVFQLLNQTGRNIYAYDFVRCSK